MAAPRSATKYTNCFPAANEEWDVPTGLMQGSAEGGADALLVVHVFVSVKVERPPGRVLALDPDGSEPWGAWKASFVRLQRVCTPVTLRGRGGDSPGPRRRSRRRRWPTPVTLFRSLAASVST